MATWTLLKQIWWIMDKSLGYIKIRLITICVLVIGHFWKSKFLHGQDALKYEPECEQTRKYLTWWIWCCRTLKKYSWMVKSIGTCWKRLIKFSLWNYFTINTYKYIALFSVIIWKRKKQCEDKYDTNNKDIGM